MGVVRLILTVDKALEAVGGEVLVEGEALQELGVYRQGLSGKTGEAVEDSLVADREPAGDRADAASGGDSAQYLIVGEGAFDKVVEPEGLLGEASPAGEAAKAGDSAEGLRLVASCDVVPSLARRCFVVIAAESVGTKGGDSHESSSLKVVILSISGVSNLLLQLPTCFEPLKMFHVKHSSDIEVCFKASPPTTPPLYLHPL